MIRMMMRRMTGDRWPAIKPGEQLLCPEVGRLLQRFLDDELDDPHAVDGLAAHLEMCARCELEADTYRKIKEALEARRPDLDPGTIERLRRFGASLTTE